MAYGPAYPHDPIEEIGPDVFMVRGEIKMNAVMALSRNMAIVRSGGELSLINPIRLSPEGESALKALGTPKRIIRLGAFHGVDDPYYVDTFGAEFWAQAGGTTHLEPKIDVEITDATALPFEDGKFFLFNGTKHPECVLLIERAGGILLTCDAIQNYGDYSHNSLATKIMMPIIGFPKTCLVGPLWLKGVTPEGGSLKTEFERLLTLDFDRLLAGHGTLLPSGAHDAVERAVAKAFPD